MRVFKLIFPWAVLAFILTDCQQPGPPGAGASQGGSLPVYGVWAMSTQEFDGTNQLNDQWRLTIQSSTIALAITCSVNGGGGSATSTASAPASVSSGQIVINQAAQQTQLIPGTFSQCNSQLPPGTYPYTVSGTSLSLMVNAIPLQFTRSQ